MRRILYDPNQLDIKERTMQGIWRLPVLTSLGFAGVLISPLEPADAAQFAAAARGTPSQSAIVKIDRRQSPYWYERDGGYPTDYILPPMPSMRVYRYNPRPPPPPVRYEPPVYGWLAPPPPPASCGQYRYWNGEYCADARREPPYIGPRW